MSADVKSLINHYARAGLFRHIQTVCDEVIKKRGKDPTLVFWKSYALAMEGSHAEAVRTLEAVASHRDIEFPATCALIHYHRSSRKVDRSAIGALEATLKSAEERSSPGSKILAATFYLHVEQHGRARAYIDKVLETNPDDVQALIVSGWIDLLLPRNSKRNIEKIHSSVEIFNRVLELSGTKKELEALMGKARYHMNKREYEAATESLNQAMVMYPWFVPALLEKAIILLMQDEYEGAVELCEKVLEQDPTNVQCLRLIPFMNLTREYNPSSAAANIAKLAKSLEYDEPNNPRLYFNIARPLARLAGGSNQVLSQTLQLMERARKLLPDSSEFATEYGYQQALRREYSRATESYKEAAKLDESNVHALSGMIYCQLIQGKVKDAEEQLELFRMIQDTIGRTSEVAFLDALLAWRKNQDQAKHVRGLDEAVALHFEERKAANRVSGGLDIYDDMRVFNPQYLLEIIREYMVHVGGEPQAVGGATATPLDQALTLLRKLTGKVPGFLEAQYLLANAIYLGGNAEEAHRTLERCFRLDNSFVPAYLLAAKIHLASNNTAGASSMLDQAMTHNFKVRESPLYHIVKATVLEAQGEYEQAVSTLRAALELPSMKALARRGRGGGGGGGGGGEAPPPASVDEPSLHDRAQAYVKLIGALTHLERLKEAAQVVVAATKEFTGTSEEVQILIARSEIDIKRGRLDKAISMLGNVPFSSPAYQKAQMTKANIYLKHRRNKIKYIQCYKELVERSPSEAAYVQLGEAYMNIQMPDEAIEAFSKALDMSSDANPALSSKTGQALVATHDYRGAVEYYEAALASDPDATQLRSDLIELYIKLRRFDKATDLLDAALAQASRDEDLTALISTRDNLLLLGRVHQSQGNVPEGIDALARALTIQNRVISKLRSIQPDQMREQRVEAAKICHKLAEAHDALRPKQEEKAIAYCQEALKASETFEPAMLTLAKLHLRRGELDECQSQCTTLTRVNRDSEEASIMLADLMFRKNETEAAMYHFQSLLEKQPRHYNALKRLVVLLKRAGRLKDVPKFLRLAERSSPRAVHDSGFKYCKGLYHWYNNEPHDAITLFNQVRFSGDWGLPAIENMVEIYTNPENQDLWVDDESSERNESVEGGEPQRVAERLLQDIPTSAQTHRHVVLGAYIAVATKRRSDIDAAVARLSEVLQQDMNYVPALVALATALLLQKQTPKARNHLKRVSRMTYDSDYHDDLMKGWLMLADIYNASGKYDMAQELCRRVLSYDQSCSRAWEYLGVIMEKEQAYADAADNYEKAWDHSNNASAVIGYKLAFNYLKAKRFVEAISVCHRVMELFPEYPRIKKDILDKARANIRP